MSVFQVQLQNTQQGQLDLNPATASSILIGNVGGNYQGAEMNPSLQRTIFVAGPHRIYRELFDGATFTDCNYWKRFAFPQVPLNQAFIKVVTDDGSVWSDFSEENNMPIMTTLTLADASTFATAGNSIDILGTYGSFASFVQISNNGVATTQNVKYELNGSALAIMTLVGGDTQVFNSGDITISKLSFQPSTTSAGNGTTVSIILSINSVCNT